MSDDKRQIADNKFGKTPPSDGTVAVDPKTGYDIKKQKADLKKTTVSENQHA